MKDTRPPESHQDRVTGPIIIDVTFSPQIAAEFRAKKVRAFVPISAAELIWLESLPAAPAIKE
jgi:hypothetical protein